MAQKAGVRKAMVKALEAEFGERFGLKFSIGGQVRSPSVVPHCWIRALTLDAIR